MEAAATCPWCEAPRHDGPDCPRCGANYAKAAAIRKHGRAEVAPATATMAAATATTDEVDATIVYAGGSGLEESAVIDDPLTEFRFCVATIPLMLMLALLFNAFEWGRFVQRLAFTMPVHELGHAVTAWFCGFGAIPTVWVTISAEERGIVAPVLVFATIAWIAYRGWQMDSRGLITAAVLMLGLQVLGTVLIRERTAEALIVFGGDGIGMILTILLMGSFFYGKSTQLYKGSLRWGFVAIGAAAFVDINDTWWTARRDATEIPYMTRANGLESDALRLVNDYGWSEAALVNRHIGMCLACIAMLALVYAWGVRKAWLKAQEADSRIQRHRA